MKFPHGSSKGRMKSVGPGNWMHWSHKVVFVIPILLLHLGFIIALTILLQRYQNELPKISAAQENPTTIPPEPSIFIFLQQNTGAYSAWQYLPTTYSVLLGVLWEPVDAAVRLLEPYQQLRNPDGVSVRDSLSLDYITAFTFFVPIRSAMRKHWVVMLSSVVYIVAFTVIPAMAGVVWTINWAPLDSETDGPFYATITMNRGVIIATCAMNAVLIVLGAVLMYILQVRRTGLPRNPKSIGGIASLVCESPVLNLFQQINSRADTELIEDILQGIRFRLEPQAVTLNNGNTHQTLQITTNVDTNHALSYSQVSGQTRARAHGDWLSKKRVWACEIFFLASQTIIVPAIGFGSFFVIHDHDAYEKNIKPQVVKICYVVIISISGCLFQWIHRDIHIFEPYRRFLHLTAPKRFRDAVGRDFISAGNILTIFRSLYRRSFLVAWTAFSSLIFLIATIFFPTIFELLFNLSTDPSFAGKTASSLEKVLPAGSATYYKNLEYWAIAIHAVLLANFIAILATGQCKPFMPRQPTTLASNMLYLCNSRRLLSALRGTSTLGKGEYERYLNTVERSCWFGWFRDEKGAFVGVEIVAVGGESDNRVQDFVFGMQAPIGAH